MVQEEFIESPDTADADFELPPKQDKGKTKDLQFQSFTPDGLGELMDADVQRVVNLCGLEVVVYPFVPIGPYLILLKELGSRYHLQAFPLEYRSTVREVHGLVVCGDEARRGTTRGRVEAWP